MTGQTWDDFTSALADDLTQMRVLDTRIYTTTGGRYIQVQALPDHITLQTVNNTFLTGDDALTSDEEQALRDLGWHPPGDGQPNWYHNVAKPLDTDRSRHAAHLLTITIQRILAPAEPADLTTEAFNAQ